MTKVAATAMDAQVYAAAVVEILAAYGVLGPFLGPLVSCEAFFFFFFLVPLGKNKRFVGLDCMLIFVLVIVDAKAVQGDGSANATAALTGLAAAAQQLLAILTGLNQITGVST